MGSTIFKDKLGNEGLKKGATYKAGSLGYDHRMVDDLVDRFLERKTADSLDVFSQDVENDFSPRLGAYPDLNVEGLIDAVIRRLESEVRFLHAKSVGSVLNPLVSLMYTLGHENCSLDLRGIDAMQYKILADIEATEEKPFSVVLRLAKNARRLDANYVAYGLKHCKVRLFGSAETVGDHGSHSDYILEEKVWQVGDMASDCVFRFPHVKDAIHTNRHSVEHTGRYSLKMMREGPYFGLSVEDTFFANRNTILIPDGPGRWKEVTPG